MILKRQLIFNKVSVKKNLMDVCDTNENMPGVLFQQQKH